MTGISWTLTGRKSLLAIMGEKVSSMTVRTKAFLVVLFRFLLTLGGFGFVSAGIWIAVGMWAGFVAIGLSLLVLEWMVKR